VAPPDDSSDTSLNPRRQEVLRLVVRFHVQTGEPVGSRTVSRSHPEKLSPASIRNIMADLEDEGFLTQPHPSAGRIPTDKGYRYFVDDLLEVGQINRDEVTRIEEALRTTRGEVRTVLEEASHLLSVLSRSVGVVVAPDLAQTLFEHIEFVRIGPRQIVGIFVARSGVVNHRVIQVEEDYGQEQLDRLAALVVRRFAGQTLPEVRRALLDAMSREKEGMDRFLAEALKLTRLYLDQASEGKRVYLGGRASLAGQPEFSDPERLQELMAAFEEKGRLVRILNRCLESDGMKVQIGSENPEPEMSACSVVASPYGTKDRHLGAVGIIGPTRMEYARAVALVDTMARTMSQALFEQEDAQEDEEEAS
jgi:heat-inducible transcriptional repressor